MRVATKKKPNERKLDIVFSCSLQVTVFFLFFFYFFKFVDIVFTAMSLFIYVFFPIDAEPLGIGLT